MKKFIMCFVLILVMLPISAFAATGDQEVTAIKAGNLHVLYNGVEQAFTNVNGTVVIPLSYDGTTYLPVRALSNLAGLNVEWDQDTKTVKLATGGTKTTYDGKPSAVTENVKVVMSLTTKITLDGEAQTFTDVNGKVVYPLCYDGTTYLPVRAVCGLVNIAVEWDDTTRTVILGTKPSSGSNTPSAEIPADAKVLTGNDVTLAGSKGTGYINGIFTLKSTGINSSGGYITVTNPGYTTLTFTVTVYGEDPYWVGAGDAGDITGKATFLERIESNTTQTCVIDVSGMKVINVCIASGATCDATVIGMYLS